MLEADGGLMFRIPRWRSSAHSLTREVRLLDFLGRYLSVRIPRPFLVGTLDRPQGWPFMVYRKLSGIPLSDLRSLRPLEQERLTKFLTKLFSDLSGSPPGPLERLGIEPGDKSAWSKRFRRLQLRYGRVAASRLSTELHREVTKLFEDLFATLEESHYRPVLLHGDLWPSHIIWNEASHAPVGVIDWEDARFGDPAFDLTAFGALGPTFAKNLVASRRTARDRTFERRLLYYRRILPLQGLVFGLETGRATIVRSHLRELRTSLLLQGT
jgi:aminoglycoside 2''-phosphotransferase